MHQHLPIFHTEHCVFCRFLSEGNSYLDCGRPCESTSVHLRDGNGKDHLVLADEGCRNTVFNAQAQSGEHPSSCWCGDDFHTWLCVCQMPAWLVSGEWIRTPLDMMVQGADSEPRLIPNP